MAERDLTNEILVAASQKGARLFRVNTGMGWTGDLKTIGYRKVLVNLRPFHAGLVKGGSDIIGLTPVVVTPDMVGKTVALFTAIEVKTGSLKPTKEQAAFLAMVEGLGGLSTVARSVEDVETLL